MPRSYALATNQAAVCHAAPGTDTVLPDALGGFTGRSARIRSATVATVATFVGLSNTQVIAAGGLPVRASARACASGSCCAYALPSADTWTSCTATARLIVCQLSILTRASRNAAVA